MSLWVRSDSALWVYTDNLSIDRYYWACYFGMAAGGLLFLVSFVGCAGTLLDSRLMFGIVSVDYGHPLVEMPQTILPKLNCN